MCVEAEGTCVGDADVAYVTMMGNDAGTCTRTAPCATIPFAIAQAGNRRVIHVLGGTLAVAPNLNITGDRVLDGEDTALSAGGTAITITAPANVTVEGFQLAAPASNMLPAINITGVGAKAVLDHIQVTGNATSLVTAGNSTDVTIQNSHFGSLTTGTNQVACSNGKMRVDRCVLETTFIGPSSGTCELIVTRNRFESNRDRSVQLTQGHLVMENNLIIHRDGFNDSISVGVLGPGSTIRFNTIVNTTALPSDGAALNCDNSVEITSNIFAYNSGHPIVGIGCSTRFSVFDDQATTAAGTGNKVTGIDTIFVNRAAGDYHLATGSVARGGAEPGLSMVTGDFEGSPRPNPAGSTADCGAFEAP